MSTTKKRKEYKRGISNRLSSDINSIDPTSYLLSGVVDSAEYEYLRSSNVVSSGSRVELTEACKWELTAVRKRLVSEHPFYASMMQAPGDLDALLHAHCVRCAAFTHTLP